MLPAGVRRSPLRNRRFARSMLVRTPGHAIRLLAAALEGRLPDDDEWPKLLETANRGWLVPALYVALRRAGCLEQVPHPVRDYLAFLHERNRERNLRLQAQLIEAVEALNRCGIRPVLLKGAVHLFTAPDANVGARMMSDLDISIDTAEMAEARAALQALGYRDAVSTRGMGRAQDAGLIELRDKPSTRSAPYLSRDLRASSPLVQRHGGSVHVPSPTARALHLIVHDMIKEGDFWRLRIDLRHLHDLAELANFGEGIDWLVLRSALHDRTGRRALEVQAAALHDLFGVQIPPELNGNALIRVRHWGRLIAGSQGMPGASVRMAGRLAWGLDRLAKAYTWRGGWDFSRRVYRVLVAPDKGARL